VICSGCSKEMKLEFIQDDDDRYAQNIYGCDNCVIVAVERVWDSPGVTFIQPDGVVKTEKVGEV
jgi:hypothetical protein